MPKMKLPALTIEVDLLKSTLDSGLERARLIGDRVIVFTPAEVATMRDVVTRIAIEITEPTT